MPFVPRPLSVEFTLSFQFSLDLRKTKNQGQLTNHLNYYNYFSEIEQFFIRRRGRNLLLSPLDWALIESWQERSVPMHIILRGIEKVFDAADKQPNKKRPVKSLLYCKEEIEAQFAEWLESQVGRGQSRQSAVGTEQSGANIHTVEKANVSQSDLFPDDAIAAHLERVSDELQVVIDKAVGDWRKALETVFNRLTALRQKSETAENLEELLEKLDALIDENLLRNFEIETLKPEIEKQIASYKAKMETDVYQRTFDLMLLKRLREQAEIPRLSLFYL